MICCAAWLRTTPKKPNNIPGLCHDRLTTDDPCSTCIFVWHRAVASPPEPAPEDLLGAGGKMIDTAGRWQAAGHGQAGRITRHMLSMVRNEASREHRSPSKPSQVHNADKRESRAQQRALGPVDILSIPASTPSSPSIPFQLSTQLADTECFSDTLARTLGSMCAMRAMRATISTPCVPSSLLHSPPTGTS